MDCIFCKIIAKEIPAEIVYEDEKITAFKDIKPLAPIHVLVLPKKHILSVDHLELDEAELIGKMILAAQRVARGQNIAGSGYKLVFNVGRGGGQIVDHLHLHLLGGWKAEKEKDVPGMP